MRELTISEQETVNGGWSWADFWFGVSVGEAVVVCCL